jgi:tRNA pseudouridine55 synthase
MATGVLVILVGRAAKASEYLASDRKQYRAVLRLGMTTETEDVTGDVLTKSEQLPSFSDVEVVLPSFRGKIQQVPPMYSALKVNGKKLVDLAREGQIIEREAREIEIFDLKMTATDIPSDYNLTVTCSGGTYIRTLCADIGAKLGCGGVMAALERTEACGFSIADAHTVDELEQMSMEDRQALLIPTESLFDTLPEVHLIEFYERLIRSGCAVQQKKLKCDFALGQRLRIADAVGQFFALGEVIEDDGGLAIKSVKLFVL